MLIRPGRGFYPRTQLSGKELTVDRVIERERLIKHICESIRLYSPAQRIDAFFKMRIRLQKTDIATLRQIVEEDVVNVTAAQFLREAAAR
jgi:hypothetical protein